MLVNTAAAYVSIRPHTSELLHMLIMLVNTAAAYGSIRPHTSQVSIRQHTSELLRMLSVLVKTAAELLSICICMSYYVYDEGEEDDGIR